MFSEPQDLAKAAQRLLDLAKSPDLDAQAIAALELGAAMLCHHVRDWHEKVGFDPKSHQAFKDAFPEWGPLSHVSNGVKHAKPHIGESDLSEVRPVEWEDPDFWSADHDRPILFIDVRGEQRAISALVFNFAKAYIEHVEGAGSSPLFDGVPKKMRQRHSL